MDNNKIDALIFDMDGTLWDGVLAYANGFNDYFKKYNINRKISKEDINGFMGMEEDEFLAEVLPELPYEKRKEAYLEVNQFQNIRIEKEGGEIYPSVIKGLEQLHKKYKLFIVSNCAEHTIKYFMKWAKIEHLILDSKAHGENYLPKYKNINLLIKKHQLQHPVYIGDTDSDAKHSKLVPLPFIFVDYGFGQTDNFENKFSSFQELTNHFINLS